MFTGIHVKASKSLILRFFALFLIITVQASVIPPAFSYDFSKKRFAVGVKKVAAIAIQFPDMAPSSTIGDLRHRIFDDMGDYYQNVSYGQMSITGEIADAWVSLSRNMSYYGNFNGANAHSEGAQVLIRDALEDSNGLLNFSLFDYVLVVHTGDDEARSQNLTDIWSWGFWDGLSASAKDGTVFNQGAVVSELDGLGTFCHEFGHILGLPDLYDTDPNSTRDFVAYWDLMAKGSYNGVPEGTRPAHISAWGKIFLGWINESQIVQTMADTSINVTIGPLEVVSEETKAVRISIAPKFYYLIEVRIDENLPGQGVLITRINETKNSGQGIVEVIDSKNSTELLFDAVFNVGDFFEETEHQFTVKVAARLKDSSLTVQISNKLVPHVKMAAPDRIEAYQEVRIEAQVVNYNATPLQGLATILFVNGEMHQTRVTDANGTVVYILNFGLLSTGKRSITISVVGGDRFIDNQIDQILEVTIPWWFIPLITSVAVLALVVTGILYWRSRTIRQRTNNPERLATPLSLLFFLRKH